MSFVANIAVMNPFGIVPLELLKHMRVWNFHCHVAFNWEKERTFGPLLRGCVELLLDFVVCRFLVSTNLVKEDLPFSLQKAL